MKRNIFILGVFFNSYFLDNNKEKKDNVDIESVLLYLGVKSKTQNSHERFKEEIKRMLSKYREEVDSKTPLAVHEELCSISAIESQIRNQVAQCNLKENIFPLIFAEFAHIKEIEIVTLFYINKSANIQDKIKIIIPNILKEEFFKDIPTSLRNLIESGEINDICTVENYNNNPHGEYVLISRIKKDINFTDYEKQNFLKLLKNNKNKLSERLIYLIKFLEIINKDEKNKSLCILNNVMSEKKLPSMLVKHIILQNIILLMKDFIYKIYKI